MDLEISKKALKYLKANKKNINEKFAGDHVCPPDENPVSIFMAGSSGAGKTEFSKRFLVQAKLKAVRIDADEIRDIIPYYNKQNAQDMQGAASLGVEYLYDYALKKKKNILLDSTFSNLEKSLKNIERSIAKGRRVLIHYLYQDPIIAWQFTLAREKTEGRPIPKDFFIASFLKSRKNVNTVKAIFGDKILLNVFVKDYENEVRLSKLNIKSVNTIIQKSYKYESLIKLI